MRLAALTLCLAVACGSAPAPSPPATGPVVGTSAPPAPAPAPAAPEDPVPLHLVDPDGFCAHAAELLGAEIAACNPVPKVKDLFNVAIAKADGAQERRLVPLRDGKPDSARGPAAATAFLRRTGAMNDGDVGLAQVMLVLRAYDAIPAPLTFDSQDPLPSVGTPALDRAPWKVVLYRDLTDNRGTPSATRRWARGTLTAGASGKLAWTLEESDGATWKTTGTVAAE